MGPRIREDDKKGPFELSSPSPEPFCVRRGVLSAKERHPRMFLSGTGIQSWFDAWTPAFAGVTEWWPAWKCKRPPVARGPSYYCASTVCVVARLCSWDNWDNWDNWEHVGDGDDVVDRIPSHVAAE